MGRRTGRKLVLQALYQADLRQEDIDTIIDDFFSNYVKESDMTSWSKELTKDIWNKKEELDEIITKYSIDWEIDRINIIDRNIIRIAIFELTNTDTDIAVILNEAIELAKKYSTDESPKFINGILGTYVEGKCLPESSKK
jgi:transcription antitermination protein NusB